MKLKKNLHQRAARVCVMSWVERQIRCSHYVCFNETFNLHWQWISDKNVLETTKFEKKKKLALFWRREFIYSLLKGHQSFVLFFQNKNDFLFTFRNHGCHRRHATSVAFFDGRWKCLNHWTAQIASSYQEITSCYLVLIRLFCCFQDRRGANPVFLPARFCILAPRAASCVLYCGGIAPLI